MKRAALLLLLLPAARAAALDPDPAVLRIEQDRIAVMARAKDAVLAVLSPDGAGGGSGAVITPDGYGVTNYHVVKPCGSYMKCGMADGRLYDAVLVGLDPVGDVALIKLFGRDDFPTATLADSDQLRAGDWVFAMGNPFLLATDYQPTVTFGILSGVHRYQPPAGTLLEYTDCIQTDASINPGNSGGPLFDSQGRQIGIIGRASFEKRGRVNVGVGYAISINQVKNFLGGLRGGRLMDHATLGAQVAADEEGRVVVSNILETSDAYRRGLRYGDEIVSFGGRPIDTPNGLKNVLGIYPKGWRVPLSYRREGKRSDILVRLAGVHSEEELIEKTSDETPAEPDPGPKPEKEKAKRPPHPHGPPEGEEPEHPPVPDLHLQKQVPIPEIVQKHYEARRGYANYYFNRENRQRVWKAWTAHGDFSSLAGTWTLVGLAGGATQVRFQLSDAGAALKLPNNEWKWNTADPLDAAMVPPGSNGLLLAMYLWRRLAVLGPERFGEVAYLGQFPCPEPDRSMEVLSALHLGVECRFLFSPQTGDLVGLELHRAEDVDPCEVYFEYRTLDGRRVPQSMKVRVGDETFGTFTFSDCQMEPSGK